MSSGDYGNAVGRWQGVGPYYAMFPTKFADLVVAQYTERGEIVLDPFAGRGTAIFSAAHQHRIGIGIEVNPVGWVYAKTKLAPAKPDLVINRLLHIGKCAKEYSEEAESLPEFFHHCFSTKVRTFLTAARSMLKWRENQVDRTLAAFIMIYLHGKVGAALSNQMRQTKSMAPEYSVRWWQERKLTPPDLDPVAFILKRVNWRYAKGVIDSPESEVYLGNSEDEIVRLKYGRYSEERPAKLLFTSPPYFSVTNYHYDQWLRLWFLGGPPSANRQLGSQDIRGKFESETRYRSLLENVFMACAGLMAKESIIYVRTGAGRITLPATLEFLQKAFPAHEMRQELQPYSRPTQTSLFGDSGKKAGEVDIIMAPT